MKMSGSRHQERPKPPTVDQIMSDIKSTKLDDPIFAFGTTPGGSRDSTPISSNDNSFDLGLSQEKSETDQDGGKNPNTADISATYLKTLQLLNMMDMLKNSSDSLKDQYVQLEKLGVEVTEAIASLKSAAQTVNPK